MVLYGLVYRLDLTPQDSRDILLSKTLGSNVDKSFINIKVLIVPDDTRAER